uniref:Uncharacterized protein n=1 Tax=Arundo donax TaxID=35708 RepID=A0A0A9EKG9_ARUDO
MRQALQQRAQSGKLSSFYFAMPIRKGWSMAEPGLSNSFMEAGTYSLDL